MLQVNFVRNGQRQGKGFFAINEWGAGPDFNLNPSGQPHNISGVANRPIRQFITAAFMMVNGGSCGVYLTCIQCYGGHAGGLGNLSIWPEYSAKVGHPLGEPAKDSGTGVWTRRYSAGVALVNPTNVSRTVALPSGSIQSVDDKTSDACGWKNLYMYKGGARATGFTAAGKI